MEYTLKDGENCKNYENIRREREREGEGGVPMLRHVRGVSL